MNTAHDTSVNLHRPALARPRGTRRNALWLLDGALAVQLAVWISALLTTRNLGSAAGQAHPGWHATLVIGGAIWLGQFALAVVLAHVRSRHQSS
jgi:hypothetical protein